jgi:hypothetical protein
MGAQRTEVVTEESMLKALSDLEEDILKAEAQSDDTSMEASSDDESEPAKKAKKSHIREDRAPMKTLPKTTKEATQSLDEDAGEGPTADVSAKSFRDELRGSGNVRKALDASPFLEGLVGGVSDEIDGMRKAILYVQEVNAAAVEDQADFNRKLSKAVIQMGNLISEQHAMIQQLGGRPAGARKSITNSSEVQERFQKSAGEGGVGSGEYQFDRATVLRKAVQMVEQGKLPGGVVIGYETSGSMEPQFQKAVYNELMKDAN